MAGGTAADLVARVGIDYGAFAVGMRNMRNDTAGFTVYLKRFSGIIGAAFGTATLAIGYATKVATDFEYALVKLGNVTNAGKEELSAFGKAAMKMGADMGYGATEVVKGMSYLGQAGFTTNEIMATMPSILKLATVAQMDLEEAANTTAVAIRSFNLDVAEAGRVASVYAVVADATQTSIKGIAVAMRYVSPIASAVGWSINETATAIGLMSQKGYDASIAGTALRGVLTRILTPTKQSGNLIEMMGYKFKNANGGVKSLVDLIKEFERTGISGGMAAELFGSRASAAVIGLANTSITVGDTVYRGAEAAQYMLDKVAAGSEYISKSFAKYAETTKIKWDMMMSSMQNVGIALGEKILPYIKDFLSQDLSPWLKQLQAWVRDDKAVEESIKNVYAMFKTWAYFVKDFLENTGPTMAKDFVTMLKSIQEVVGQVVVGWKALGDYYKKLTGTPVETNIFKALAQDASDFLGSMALVIDKITELSGLTPIKLFPSSAETEAEAAQFAEDFWAGVAKDTPEVLWSIVDTIARSIFKGMELGINKLAQVGREIISISTLSDLSGTFTDLADKMKEAADKAGAPELTVDPEAGLGAFFDQENEAADRYVKWLNELGVELDNIAPKLETQSSLFDEMADQMGDFAESDAVKTVADAAKAIGAKVNKATSPDVSTTTPAEDLAARYEKEKALQIKKAEEQIELLQAGADAETKIYTDSHKMKAGYLVAYQEDFRKAMAAQGGELKTAADEAYAQIKTNGDAGLAYITENMVLTKDQIASTFTMMAENATTTMESFNNLLLAQTMSFQSEAMIWGETFMGFFGIVEQGMNEMVGSLLFGGQSIGQIFMNIGKQMVTSMVASFIKIQMQHLMSSLGQRVTEEALSKAKQQTALTTARVQLTANATAAASAAAAWAAAMGGPAAATAAYSGVFSTLMTSGMAALGAATAAGGILGAGGKVGSNGLDMGGTGLVGTGSATKGITGGGMADPATGIGMATGGIVTRPTHIIAGEAGEPEAFVPLSKAEEMGFGGGTVNNYYFNVLGSIDDASAIKITEGINRVVITRDVPLNASSAVRASYVDGSRA